MVYVAEPADDSVSADFRPYRSRPAASARVCSAHSASGTIWQVDAALRPDGNAACWVRTLASHRAYYMGQELGVPCDAQGPADGRDLELGRQFVEMAA